MKTSDFYFDLPDELIAQTPLEKRDESRLMCLNKNTGEIEHRKFNELLDFLGENDVLVLNNTRVIPARIFGEKENTGGKVEFLLLKRMEDDSWEVLVKPGKKAKPGDTIVFSDELKANVLRVGDEGARIVKFEYEGVFEEILDRVGNMPLPPYITERLEDKERYQTVYSKHQGSAAAPTAGLHFTKEMLGKLKEKGVQIEFVTLHVGLGTFRPVKVDNVLEHKMHSEYYEVSVETARNLNKYKQENKRVIAVGTTSCRTLESATDENGMIKEGKGWTEIFIYPGYQFRMVDSLITNFHLPESTLIMLVSTLAGKEETLKAYEEAVKEKYRFFSFGDAMFING